MAIPQPAKAICPRLYKYSGPDHPEWLKTIILENELYLPTLSQLNDPADGLPKLRMQSEDEMVSFFYAQYLRLHPELTPAQRVEQEAIIRFNTRHHTPATIHPIMVEALDAELQGYRIYSLTKRFDKMNLWAQYGGQHRGYCLEFVNEGPLFDHAKEVTYLDPSQMEIAITDPAIKNGDFFFCKSRDWSNEEEVRLVLPRNKGSKVKIDPRWLARLILGKGMAENDERLIREWAKQREPELTVANAFFDPVTRTIKIRT